MKEMPTMASALEGPLDKDDNEGYLGKNWESTTHLQTKNLRLWDLAGDLESEKERERQPL